jgi:pyrroline-5-carboxylate reductase
MNDTILSFIGGGNMAGSLIAGLITDGWNPASIRVSDSDNRQLERLSQRFPIMTTSDNAQAVKDADVVIMAVKPQVMEGVASALAASVSSKQPLVISIAAGIPEDALRQWLGDKTAIGRCMPNTPAMVQSGATAMYANSFVTDEQRSIAESILRAVGIIIWVDDEAMMDAVTALSGSGPAYIFLFLEALQSAGRELGFSGETAYLLALQTVFGAAKMALESEEDAATLRQRVTSPGGTTEHAISTFQEGGFEKLVSKALHAAAERSRELAKEFGSSK